MWASSVSLCQKDRPQHLYHVKVSQRELTPNAKGKTFRWRTLNKLQCLPPRFSHRYSYSSWSFISVSTIVMPVSAVVTSHVDSRVNVSQAPISPQNVSQIPIGPYDTLWRARDYYALPFHFTVYHFFFIKEFVIFLAKYLSDAKKWSSHTQRMCLK